MPPVLPLLPLLPGVRRHSHPLLSPLVLLLPPRRRPATLPRARRPCLPVSRLLPPRRSPLLLMLLLVVLLLPLVLLVL